MYMRGGTGFEHLGVGLIIYVSGGGRWGETRYG